MRCLRSGYAANVEVVARPLREPLQSKRSLEGPWCTPTIATLVDWANGAVLARAYGRPVTAADALKDISDVAPPRQ